MKCIQSKYKQFLWTNQKYQLKKNCFLRNIFDKNTTFSKEQKIHEISTTCLLRNKFCHHISGMDIYGTNCHDLLPVSR